VHLTKLRQSGITWDEGPETHANVGWVLEGEGPKSELNWRARLTSGTDDGAGREELKLAARKRSTPGLNRASPLES
jgi:hypothetical protein